MLLLLAWRAGQRERPRRRPGEGTVRRVGDRARNRIVFRPRYKGLEYNSFSVRLDLPARERAAAEEAARTRAEWALSELRRRVDQGETPSPRDERRTVASAVAAFLAEVEAAHGEHARTPEFYRNQCRRITGQALGRVALRDVPIGPIAAVCLYAKARIGEACGLSWRHVDWAGERLTIAQQVVHGSTRLEAVKGRRAVTLPVARDLVTWLAGWRERERAAGRACGPDELVFVDEKRTRRRAPGPENGAVTYSRASKAFARLAAAAGLDPRYATHRLRHSGAALSVAVGTPLPVIQRQMRHRDIRTTMVYAGHEDDALARADAAAVARRLRGG
jgi:integrase